MIRLIAALAFLIFGVLSCATANAESPSDRTMFADLQRLAWKTAFSDSCTSDDTRSWNQNWFLDGEHAIVTNSAQAMTIDASQGFAVLWTKQEFSGDLRIEYDFKRVDSNDRGVNIIYIQARGDGQSGHQADISKWSDRRREAKMSDYYSNMHTYHISYAAFPDDYIRGRRYMPHLNNKLKGTELTGEAFDTGLFDDQQWIHITIVKRDKDILVEFKSPILPSLLCRLENQDKLAIKAGRIGLRLMPGRISQFRNFRVDHLQPAK